MTESDLAQVNRARWALRATFFFMGMMVSATGARFAEIKYNVHATNGVFGSWLLFGNLGAMTGSFVGGRVAHRLGTRRLVQSIMVVIALGQIGYGFMNAVWQVPVNAAIVSFAYSFGNVGVNSQGAMIEAKSGKSLMPSFHGSWSVGALAATLISGVIAKHLTPATHLSINAGLALIAVLIVSRGLLPFSADKEDLATYHEVKQSDSIPPHLNHFLFLVAIGSFLGLMAESSVGDWSAIFLRENLHVGIGTNSLGFSSFLLMQIVGRFNAGRLIDKFGIPTVVKWSGVLGGIGYGAGLILSLILVGSHQGVAVVVMCLAYAMLGLGVAPMPPAYVTISGLIPGIPTTRGFARMALISAFGFLVGRGLISLCTGLFGLRFSLIIPALCMIGSGFIAQGLKVEDLTFENPTPNK